MLVALFVSCFALDKKFGFELIFDPKGLLALLPPIRGLEYDWGSGSVGFSCSANLNCSTGLSTSFCFSESVNFGLKLKLAKSNST